MRTTLSKLFHEITHPRCSGLEIAALALAAAGTGASIYGGQQAREAMDDKTRAELLRQRGYEKENKATFAESLKGATPESAKQQIDSGEAKALAEYEKQAAIPIAATSGLSVAPAANQAVDTERNAGFGRLIGRPNATMQGFNNYTLQQFIKNAMANRQLGVTGHLSQSSQDVLPLELQGAAHAGDTMQGIGSILSALGGVAGVAGGLSAGAGVASSTAAQNAARMASLGLGGTAGMFRNRQAVPSLLN